MGPLVAIVHMRDLLKYLQKMEEMAKRLNFMKDEPAECEG